MSTELAFASAHDSYTSEIWHGRSLLTSNEAIKQAIIWN